MDTTEELNIARQIILGCGHCPTRLKASDCSQSTSATLSFFEVEYILTEIRLGGNKKILF